jgi:hypothetical protein
MNKYFKILLGIALAVIVITVVLWQLPGVRYAYLGSTMDVQEVNFYGRIIDQNGEPVVGAIIPYELGGSALSGSNGAGQVLSDANGNFVINRVKGSGLLLKTINHPDIEFGYPIPEHSERTTYSSSLLNQMNVRGFQSHEGANDVLWTDTSPENPYVFKAWRVGGEVGQYSNDLKVGEFSTKFDYEKLYTVNFLKPIMEQFKEGEYEGQFRVIFHREADAEDVTQRWEARLIPVDGGIQVTKDPYMNIAPEDGYEPEIHIVREKTGYDSIDNLSNQQYYIKANNGQIYGSLFVAFNAKSSSGRMRVIINYKLNVQGERSLVQAKDNQ